MDGYWLKLFVGIGCRKSMIYRGKSTLIRLCSPDERRSLGGVSFTAESSVAKDRISAD